MRVDDSLSLSLPNLPLRGCALNLLGEVSSYEVHQQKERHQSVYQEVNME